MANNNDGQIVLGLDIPKTVNQINSDIKKLQNQLEQVKTTGALDTSTTVKQINAQIASLQSQLKNIELKANINTGNIINQAQQVGQQISNNIGQQVSQSISSAIQKGTMSNLKEFKFDGKLLQNDVAKKALEDFKALGQGVVTVKEEMKNIDGKNLLNGFTINIKNAKGEVETLKYALKDIENKTGQSFQYIGGSINDNGVIKQMNTISAYRH